MVVLCVCMRGGAPSFRCLPQVNVTTNVSSMAATLSSRLTGYEGGCGGGGGGGVRY